MISKNINHIKSIFLVKTYKRIRILCISILAKLSPYIATKLLFKKRIGKYPNLKAPKDFNEKIQWLKLYWQHPLVIECGDKYTVRQYIKRLGVPEILNYIHGVYNSPIEINWEALPKKFVLKISNGCGYNIVVKNKDNLSINEINSKLNHWLNENYSLKFVEPHYAKMQSKIICEEFIESTDGSLPTDYKIYCFNGKPEIVLVTTDREHSYQRTFLNMQWKVLDIERDNIKGVKRQFSKPKSFEAMKVYAEKLSKPFPFVRIDFYDHNGSPRLGEMTFTPVGGMARYFKEDVLLKLGDKIILPEKLNSKKNINNSE